MVNAFLVAFFNITRTFLKWKSNLKSIQNFLGLSVSSLMPYVDHIHLGGYPSSLYSLPSSSRRICDVSMYMLRCGGY
jgi:hypothetical protein